MKRSSSPHSSEGRAEWGEGARQVCVCVCVRLRPPSAPAYPPKNICTRARSVAEMLFCTSLLAFVGAGEQPALTPRKLTLLNTSSQRVIQELSFQYAVLAVKLNRSRCGAQRAFPEARTESALCVCISTFPQGRGQRWQPASACPPGAPDMPPGLCLPLWQKVP